MTRHVCKLSITLYIILKRRCYNELKRTVIINVAHRAEKTCNNKPRTNPCSSALLLLGQRPVALASLILFSCFLLRILKFWPVRQRSAICRAIYHPDKRKCLQQGLADTRCRLPCNHHANSRICYDDTTYAIINWALTALRIQCWTYDNIGQRNQTLRWKKSVNSESTPLMRHRR